MPRKKPAQMDFGSTLHLGVHNPNYVGDDVANLPPTTHYVSRHWSELNPALLAQECVRRGKWEGRYQILHRVQWMERDGDGWLISCYLGPPVSAGPEGAWDAVAPEYTEYRVTDFEVEAGRMMEAAA